MTKRINKLWDRIANQQQPLPREFQYLTGQLANLSTRIHRSY